MQRVPHVVRPSLIAAACGMLLAALAAGCAAPSGKPVALADAARMERIKYVVVIYAENHSFDNMYGLFPGANGISRATPEQATQMDHDGTPLPELIVFGSDGKPDPRFPRMPNKPFRIDAPPVNRPPTQIVPSPIHAFFHNQEQINGGKNNMFAAMSTVGGWTMGYYDGSQFRMWQWAREYTLADNFFMGAFGGSYLNHQYLVCACAPRHDEAPESMRAQSGRERQARKTAGLAVSRRGCGTGAQRWARWPGHAGRVFRQHLAATLPAQRRSARCRRAARDGQPQGRQQAWQHRPGRARAAADRQDHRRHPVGQRRVLGLVCGGLSQGAGGRHPGAGRGATHHLQPCSRLAQFPAAPPALQLLRALCARHRRPRAPSAGWRGLHQGGMPREGYPRSVSTSRPAWILNIRPTPTS